MDTFVNSNRLFVAFFCLSLFLHYIVFAVAPVEKLLKAGMPLLYDDSVKESDSGAVEFELEAPPEVFNTKEKPPLQEKRLSFVDTSDSPLDEEPQGDTDKIGVKAVVARDAYEGEEEVNNQPHSEGNSDGLFLSEGDSSFAEMPTEGLEGQNEPEDVGVKTAPTQMNINEKEEDKEGLEDVENPTMLAQLKPEASEMKSIEKPLELEDEGEVVPLVTPLQKQKMSQESEVVSQELKDSELKTQDPRLKSGKKINSVTKKGSPVIYEDTISNAPFHGEESFSVQRHEYAEYFQHIREKIGWYWFLSYGHDQSIKLETRNRLPIIIEFRILPSGRTDDVEIIDEAGNPLLASRIQLAIQTTLLNKFPSYVKEDFIAVRFNFYFF
ncbi:MAG TPA: hypothetical protein ACFYD6_02970 [Candidatus Brocadiia bacterium]|nr:hypothetical protein [Candidatus Brocadiales bacterium]